MTAQRKSPGRPSFQWVMKRVALLALVFPVLMVFVHWNQLPSRIPMHFVLSGIPDGFGSKGTIVFLPVLGIGVYVLLSTVARRPELANLPIAMDRSTFQVQRLVVDLVVTLKAVVLVIFAYTERAIVSSGLGRADELGEWFLPVSIVAFFLPVGVFLIRLWKHRQPSSLPRAD